LDNAQLEASGLASHYVFRGVREGELVAVESKALKSRMPYAE